MIYAKIKRKSLSYYSKTYFFIPLESGWVVYGPENGYNFPCLRLLTLSWALGGGG